MEEEDNSSEGLQSPYDFETVEEAEKALMNALMIYKVAKHPEDKEFLRAYIIECEITLEILKEIRSEEQKDNNNNPHQ